MLTSFLVWYTACVPLGVMISPLPLRLPRPLPCAPTLVLLSILKLIFGPPILAFLPNDIPELVPLSNTPELRRAPFGEPAIGEPGGDCDDSRDIGGGVVVRKRAMRSESVPGLRGSGPAVGRDGAESGIGLKWIRGVND